MKIRLYVFNLFDRKYHNLHQQNYDDFQGVQADYL